MNMEKVVNFVLVAFAMFCLVAMIIVATNTAPYSYTQADHDAGYVVVRFNGRLGILGR